MDEKYEKNVAFNYEEMSDSFYFELEKQITKLLGQRYGIENPEKYFLGFGFVPTVAKFIEGYGQLYGDVLGSNAYGYTVSILWKDVKNPTHQILPSDDIVPQNIEFFIEEVLSEDSLQEYIRNNTKIDTIRKKSSGYKFDIEMYMHTWPDIQLGFKMKSPLSAEEQAEIEALLWSYVKMWNERDEKTNDIESIHYIGTVKKGKAKQYQVHIDFGTCMSAEPLDFFFAQINASIGERITKLIVK